MDLPPRILEIKVKINKWDLIKLKSFLHNKGNYKQGEKIAFRMGENDSKWRNKGLISNIYRQHLQLNSRKRNDPIKKWAKDLNIHFSKENIQMANKHMKICSISLIIREMQIKTSVRYHYMPVRMAAMQKSTSNKCWRGCGEKGTLLHCWWECKLVQPLWRTVWRFLKKTGNRTAIWPGNPTPWHTHQGNQIWKRHMYPNVYCSTVYNSQDMEAT